MISFKNWVNHWALNMFLRFYLFLITFFFPFFATAQVTSFNVENVPFEADYFKSGTTGKLGIIIVTGASGEKPNEKAKKIAEIGFNVLSLAYFDPTGRHDKLPSTLEMIPLEYFDAPKKWLMNRQETKNNGVIIYGLSKGAELALLLASNDTDYKGVVALAPSSVVWAGIPRDMYQTAYASSSWSINDTPIPHLPYVKLSRQEYDKLGLNMVHVKSLENLEAVQKAVIKVENIQGPILLFSGGRDDTWPAKLMANEVCYRASALNPTLPCDHKSYFDGDHLLSNKIEEVENEISTFLTIVNLLN